MIELLLQAERAMSVGLVDRAETLYAQVAEADPKNSIAVVGLARVRLERGDEVGALELARRALAIDPENAAASRMVDRLEEVLAYRSADAAATPKAAASEPEPAAAKEPEPAPAVPEPEPEAPEATEPEPAVPEPEPEAPEPPPVPAPPPVPRPEPPPKRRSWLDRLFRRHR